MSKLIDFLSGEALQEHAYSTQANNLIFHGCSRVSPSVSIEAGDIVNLGLAYNKDLERVVVAEKGTRMILKEYFILIVDPLNYRSIC